MDPFCYLCFVRVCHVVMSVHCSLVVTCLERVGLLALLFVMFSCVFVTFPCGVHGQVWYLIVSIPDLCLLPYFACLIRFLIILVNSFSVMWGWVFLG